MKAGFNLFRVLKISETNALIPLTSTVHLPDLSRRVFFNKILFLFLSNLPKQLLNSKKKKKYFTRNKRKNKQQQKS